MTANHADMAQTLLDEKISFFLVVRKDRHCDDQLSIHITLEGANAAIEEFKARYVEGDRSPYDWKEQSYGREQKWLRYVDCHDDGPSVHIELLQIQG